MTAPLALYGSWLLFSFVYYGDLLPNTYYAKSADLWYPSNGLVYSYAFWLGSSLWLALPWLGVWAVRRSRTSAERDLKVFVLAASAAVQLYIVKVGGDFMYGRFFVALVPLVLLGVEALWHDLADRGARLAHVVFTCLALSSIGGVLHRGGWWITDENWNYPVVSLFPLEIDHTSFKDAQALAPLGKRGLRPTLGTCCIGMIGYYVDTRVIDFRGLTDRRVARMTLKERGMPGHEKWASGQYISRRRVVFSRHPWVEPPYDDLTHLRLRDTDRRRNWRIRIHNRERMEKIRKEMPHLRFVDFDAHLDRYLNRVRGLDAVRIERDLAFFDVYWFAHNEDADRRARIVAALEAARAPTPPRAPVSGPP